MDGQTKGWMMDRGIDGWVNGDSCDSYNKNMALPRWWVHGSRKSTQVDFSAFIVFLCFIIIIPLTLESLAAQRTSGKKG